jgi:hypothetical protein
VIAWGEFLAALLGLFNRVADYMKAKQAELLGRLKRDAENRVEDDRINDAIDRADPRVLSDDEAFGNADDFPDDNVPRPPQG